MYSTRNSSVVLTWESRAPFRDWIPGKSTFYSSGEMVSYNHFPLDRNVDDGGPWNMTKTEDFLTPGTLTTGRFRGQFSLQKPASYSSLTVPSQMSDSVLRSKGTTAIARSAPTNPAFSLATTFGELSREGLPSIVGSATLKDRVNLARSAGKDYLNVEFGWKPLIADLRSFAQTVKDSHRLLEEYRKGSDKKTRAGFYFPSNTSTKVGSYGNFLPIPSDVDVFGQGHISESAVSECWFKGAFRYHIPTTDTQVGKFRQWASMADHLLGVKPTPEVVWNLAPWSWAVDWFTNTGDVMTNISNLGRDGLVMQYGYAMSSVVHTVQMSARFGTASTSRKTVRSYKKRISASPYGFGVNLSSLSAKQIAVVSALGLSRT